MCVTGLKLVQKCCCHFGKSATELDARVDIRTIGTCPELFSSLGEPEQGHLPKENMSRGAIRDEQTRCSRSLLCVRCFEWMAPAAAYRVQAEVSSMLIFDTDMVNSFLRSE
jgi:hypothetical protein